MFRIVRKFYTTQKENFSSYIRKKQDVELARSEGFAAGSSSAAKEFIPKIKEQTQCISELTKENLEMEEKLRKLYNERVEVLDNRYTKKCEDCMRFTDKERERLRKDQNSILDLIQNFNMIYMKLFKHASLIIDEHDNIIKSSGRVKASRDTLTSIRTEANNIIQKALPLVGIEITEKFENKLLLQEKDEVSEKDTIKKEAN